MAHVRRSGGSVSDPVQFRDIGYLCHLRDPDGFAIELLQQGFEGHARPIGEGHPIGSQAILAHLTLRITDLVAARRVFEDQLGMRLMSVQPVRDLGFCLYFYGWSDEALPNADLQAVENREWLWARPYALVELQHLEQPVAVCERRNRMRRGFRGLDMRLNPAKPSNMFPRQTWWRSEGQSARRVVFSALCAAMSRHLDKTCNLHVFGWCECARMIATWKIETSARNELIDGECLSSCK